MFLKAIIYVISIMIITMVMILIGHYKDKTLHIELANRLYRKCSAAVVDYLKKNETASLSDIKKCISGITASVFWSRKKLGVTKPEKFAETVADNMVKQGVIVEVEKVGKKVYKLK